MLFHYTLPFSLSLFILAFTDAAPTKALTTATVPIRECMGPNTPLGPILEPFATLLESEPSLNLTAFTSGHPRRVYSQTIDGTCVQLQIINNDLFFPLMVDGKGLAYTVRGVAEQCTTSGWAYYTDATTGNSYHKSISAIVTECTTWVPKGSGGRLICPTDTTGQERHDPSLPCPGE